MSISCGCKMIRVTFQWIIHTYCTFWNWAKYSQNVNVSPIKNKFLNSRICRNVKGEKYRGIEKARIWFGNEIHKNKRLLKWNVMFKYVRRLFRDVFPCKICIIYAVQERRHQNAAARWKRQHEAHFGKIVKDSLQPFVDAFNIIIFPQYMNAYNAQGASQQIAKSDRDENSKLSCCWRALLLPPLLIKSQEIKMKLIFLSGRESFCLCLGTCHTHVLCFIAIFNRRKNFCSF